MTFFCVHYCRFKSKMNLIACFNLSKLKFKCVETLDNETPILMLISFINNKLIINNNLLLMQEAN